MKKASIQQWLFIPILIAVFTSCQPEREEGPRVTEISFTVNAFKGIYSTEAFNLIITKGAAFQVKARGEASAVYDIELVVANNLLEIGYQSSVPNRPKVDVFVTLPELEYLELEGAATGAITGFDNDPYPVSVVLKGTSKITMTGAAFNTHIDLSGGAEFTVTGLTTSLYGMLSGAGTRLNAYGLSATEADIAALDGAVARIKPGHALYATATGTGSCIYYQGNPPVKSLEMNSGGQIIQE